MVWWGLTLGWIAAIVGFLWFVHRFETHVHRQEDAKRKKAVTAHQEPKRRRR